jgi:uncharacterized protein (DUF2141 family)
MLMLLASAAPPAEVSLSIAGQRSQKGVLQICLTRDAKNFPNCVDDGQAIKRKVAATGSRFTFAGVPSGSYAIAGSTPCSASRAKASAFPVTRRSASGPHASRPRVSR